MKHLARSTVLLWMAATVAVASSNPLTAASLGASADAAGNVTFRVYSSRASRIEVWVYANPQGDAEKLALPLNDDPTSHVWSRLVRADELREAGITRTIFYGFRAWGPNWPYVATWRKGSTDGFVADVDYSGNRFNPNKLLLDPYAREVSHDYRTPAQRDGDIYLSGDMHRGTDTGDRAPKGVVFRPDGTSYGVKPARTLKDDVIYEVHLRGLTRTDSTVPANLRGTYAGAARKATYLKDFGITAIEFLPIFEFQNDTNGLTPGSVADDNYWGYDPDNFFSPDRRYASDQGWGGPTQEFKNMVRAFHDAGIKVILDVVFNHTGEGNVDANSAAVGPIHSWRGLDNGTYYELRDDNAPYYDNGRPTQWRRNAFYANNNGVGPNFNAANATARNMVIDALKYWSDELGVDGFRFDLAAVLANSQAHGDFTFDKNDPDNVLNRAVAELPGRKADGTGVDLIAEPYALGSGAFKLGNFPAGWAEWDDRFRYAIRKAQNKLGISGNEVTPAQLITLFAGSSDLFQSSGRKPFHGVNYVVAHDGFTLRDLYSYLDKKNDQPFPFGPSKGGSDNNFSWDQGGDPAKQRQAARTGMALLFVSAGVPMIVGGDEMYRTQYGNNNPFNIDNDKFYLDYHLQTVFPHFFKYARTLIAFRQAHVALRRQDFFDGTDHNGNGLKDVTWLRDNGGEADAAYLDNPSNHFIAFRLDGTESHDSASSIYVAYNGWSEDLRLQLPANMTGSRWYVAVDTAAQLEEQDNAFLPPRVFGQPQYKLLSRSAAILIEQP